MAFEIHCILVLKYQIKLESSVDVRILLPATIKT